MFGILTVFGWSQCFACVSGQALWTFATTARMRILISAVFTLVGIHWSTFSYCKVTVQFGSFTRSNSCLITARTISSRDVFFTKKIIIVINSISNSNNRSFQVKIHLLQKEFDSNRLSICWGIASLTPITTTLPTPHLVAHNGARVISSNFTHLCSYMRCWPSENRENLV